MTTGQAFAAASPSQEIAPRLAQAQQDGKVYGLHTLLVSQGGRLIIEHYGRGDDEAWGRPLGTVTFAPDMLNDLRSVSKSVVGLVYGIALAAGKVPSPEAKLYDQFPSCSSVFPLSRTASKLLARIGHEPARCRSARSDYRRSSPLPASAPRCASPRCASSNSSPPTSATRTRAAPMAVPPMHFWPGGRAPACRQR